LVLPTTSVSAFNGHPPPNTRFLDPRLTIHSAFGESAELSRTAHSIKQQLHITPLNYAVNVMMALQMNLKGEQEKRIPGFTASAALQKAHHLLSSFTGSTTQERTWLFLKVLEAAGLL